MSTPANPEPSNYDAARERFATSDGIETDPVAVARTASPPDLVTPRPRVLARTATSPPTSGWTASR